MQMVCITVLSTPCRQSKCGALHCLHFCLLVLLMTGAPDWARSHIVGLVLYKLYMLQLVFLCCPPGGSCLNKDGLIDNIK